MVVAVLGCDFPLAASHLFRGWQGYGNSGTPGLDIFYSNRAAMLLHDFFDYRQS
jgi:hypothetical protein